MTDPIVLTRNGRRKRKHMMMSSDLILMIEKLSEDEDESASEIVRRAVWSDLVDRYGRERVLELLDDVQDDIDQADRLEDSTEVVIAT